MNVPHITGHHTHGFSFDAMGIHKETAYVPLFPTTLRKLKIWAIEFCAQSEKLLKSVNVGLTLYEILMIN